MEKKYLNEKLYSCWGYREFGGDQFDHSCIPIKLLFLRLLVEDEIGTLTIQGDGKSHGWKYLLGWLDLTNYVSYSLTRKWFASLGCLEDTTKILIPLWKSRWEFRMKIAISRWRNWSHYNGVWVASIGHGYEWQQLNMKFQLHVYQCHHTQTSLHNCACINA